MKSRNAFDVFLLATRFDSATANLVRDALVEAGLVVFCSEEVTASQNVENDVHEALMQSDALVAIVTRSAIRSESVPFYLGAASGLSKPVFLVLDGVAINELPTFLARHKSIPIAKYHDIVRAVQAAAEPLSLKQRELLGKSYGKVRVPADQLASNPVELERLTRQFNVEAGSEYSRDRVLQELLRMRKQGKLPKLTGPSRRTGSKNRAAG